MMMMSKIRENIHNIQWRFKICSSVEIYNILFCFLIYRRRRDNWIILEWQSVSEDRWIWSQYWIKYVSHDPKKCVIVQWIISYSYTDYLDKYCHLHHRVKGYLEVIKFVGCLGFRVCWYSKRQERSFNINNNKKKEKQTLKSSHGVMTMYFVECFNDIITILIADEGLFEKRIE